MNTFSQGTDTWRRVTDGMGMTLTAYNPSFTAITEMEIIEPGQAVNLPPADRARMNYARPGVHTSPERL
jgi:hypothetical protein